MTAVPHLYILGSSGFAREVFFVDDYDKSGASLTAAQYLEQLRLHGGESVLGGGAL